MPKKLFLGIAFVIFIGGASLVAVAGDPPTLRELTLQLSRRNTIPTPPDLPPAPLPVPPTSSLPLPYPYPIRPRVVGPCQDDPELFAYIAERKEALRKATGVQGRLAATINFKHPFRQAELERLKEMYDIQFFNIYYVTNTDISGVCGKCDLNETEARLRSEHGDLIRVEGAESVHAVGPLAGIKRLSENPKVLLVDLAEVVSIGPDQYRPDFPLGIFWRYERSCAYSR